MMALDADELVTTHHNDGKGRWQSHEVGNKTLSIYGYGDTKEEAYRNFTVGLNAYIKTLIEYSQGATFDSLIDGDCFGNPTKKGE